MKLITGWLLMVLLPVTAAGIDGTLEQQGTAAEPGVKTEAVTTAPLCCCGLRTITDADWTPGPGMGRGMGPGWGRGPGAGQGMGSGPALRGAGRGMGPGMGRGMGPGMGMGWRGNARSIAAAQPATAAKSAVADPAQPARLTIGDVRPVFHALLADHEKIERRVEAIPGGIRSETVSDDPEVTALIRRHVRQMQQWLETGQPIRMWDPLFRELMRHADQIELEVEDIPGGARVTETSGDAYVQKLIRAHAEAVSGFSARGFEAASQAHPLPENDGDDSAEPEN